MNRIIPVAHVAAALVLALIGGNVAVAADRPVELSCHFETAHEQLAPRLTQTSVSPASVDYGSAIAAQLSNRELSCTVVDKPAAVNEGKANPVAPKQLNAFAAL